MNEREIERRLTKIEITGESTHDLVKVLSVAFHAHLLSDSAWMEAHDLKEARQEGIRVGQLSVLSVLVVIASTAGAVLGKVVFSL